jgi:hypoxanthine phosphoribosyltransferase
MKKLYCNDTRLSGWVHNIMRDMTTDGWRPDYIVGITRGGLVPALMLSQYMNIPMETLKVSLRDETSDPESNLWMAEEAFGYHRTDNLPGYSNPDLRKNILIVDDINDTGATLNWIKQDWPSGCLPSDPAWSGIWHNNVRFAVMIDNLSSEFDGKIDYYGEEINKAVDPVWVVFPWENWWET